jgi:signal transduction histidine kinase
MPVPLRRDMAALWSRAHQPQRSVRLRLTLTYGGLFLLSGAALLAITYVLDDHLPISIEKTYTSGPGKGLHGTKPRGLGRAHQLPPLPSLAAQATQQRGSDLHHLLLGSMVAVAVMAFVSIGLGWLVAGRILRPLRTITATAKQISASSLNQRLALTGPDDELKELGDTFDALLTRLERSFSSQRQFVANASHELRTPLTVERAVLEAALSDPHPNSETWRAACEQALAAGMEQERLIEALLTLARSEGGLDHWEPFDLAALTERALPALRSDADRRGLVFSSALSPAPTIGDPRLAERLVVNLVENALRYNLASGRIDVSVAASAGHALFSVANTGPIVPAAEIERLFQPFQRLRNDRAQHGSGLGLGLSIVRAIATAHGADVTTRAQPDGGLTVSVTFPSGASSPVPQ